jgi:outer membrane protein OmpA-like peptidoglycan-associated protein
MGRRVAVAWALALAVAASANAQSGTSKTSTGQSSTTAPPQSSSQAATTDTRPATTTFYGDTGLWFVPTAEIVPHGKGSGSGYRANWDYRQGLTDVSHFAITGAGGLKDRVEIFGSFRVDTRIDRDLGISGFANGPIFRPTDTTFGGLVNDYPYVRKDWSGDNLGDLLVGVKINLMSEWRQQPAAIALRGILKVPTGDKTSGAGTGKLDGMFDFIVSKEVNRAVELAGTGGFVFRGDPDDPVSVNLSNGIQWGFGAGFPSRSKLRLTTELHGELRSSDTLTASAPLASLAGIPSVSPLVSEVDNLTMGTIGLTFQARNGFFLGYGINYSWPSVDPADVGVPDHKNFWGHQVRLGYHPGVRVYVPPPPPPPPPPPAPQHTLTVKAACDPCTVEVGKTSTVTAVAQDSIGCAVTYRWSAPPGTLAQPAERVTIWTAPGQPGTVPVTVTVTCPTDNKTASDTVNIQVTQPPVKTYTFEDVYFDFDRYSLRPEATRILDEAVAAMRETPTLRVEIEGHTCSIGTAEYNLALGDRRANAVKDYLVSRGVALDRLRTVSYGEERPKYDNAREETRRLNRRAALVVNLR